MTHWLNLLGILLEEPNAISDIRKKIPSGLSGACETDNVLTQIEFNTIVSYIATGIELDEPVLSLLHSTMECYI